LHTIKIENNIPALIEKHQKLQIRQKKIDYKEKPLDCNFKILKEDKIIRKPKIKNKKNTHTCAYTRTYAKR